MPPRPTSPCTRTILDTATADRGPSRLAQQFRSRRDRALDVHCHNFNAHDLPVRGLSGTWRTSWRAMVRCPVRSHRLTRRLNCPRASDMRPCTASCSVPSASIVYVLRPWINATSPRMRTLTSWTVEDFVVQTPGVVEGPRLGDVHRWPDRPRRRRRSVVRGSQGPRPAEWCRSFPAPSVSGPLVVTGVSGKP